MNPKHSIDTKIFIEADPAGFIPEYEEREVAVFVHCSWHMWGKLTWQERAAAIAHYRMHNLIESHVNADAQAKA